LRWWRRCRREERWVRRERSSFEGRRGVVVGLGVEFAIMGGSRLWF
jgi:hypothetical protein